MKSYGVLFTRALSVMHRDGGPLRIDADSWEAACTGDVSFYRNEKLVAKIPAGEWALIYEFPVLAAEQEEFSC